MATYSNNTTIKVNTGVTASNATFVSSGTLYTVPANSYGVFNIRLNGGTGYNMTVYIGGIEFLNQQSTGSNQTVYSVHVGPGQAITWNSTSNVGGMQFLSIQGVVFTNTP